jgi:hypothetical protein
VRLDREDRRALVRELAAAGLSTRAIGPALGVARNTVRDDLDSGRRAGRAGQVDPPSPNAVSVSAQTIGFYTVGDLELAGYRVHPFLAEFPLMPPTQFDALAESICQRGLQEPILLAPDEVTIVDGRLRLLACQKTGVSPRFEVLTGAVYADEGRLLDLIYSLNVVRQHLSEDKRAMVVARAEAEGWAGP